MRVFNQSLVPMRKVQTIGQGRKKRSIRNEIESRTQDTTKWIVPSPSVVSKVRGYLHREKLPAGSAFIPTEAANGIWLSPSTSPYSVNEPERISSRRSLASSHDDSINCASYASSSTGVSTSGYGLYWIRRAYSEDTVDANIHFMNDEITLIRDTI